MAEVAILCPSLRKDRWDAIRENRRGLWAHDLDETYPYPRPL